MAVAVERLNQVAEVRLGHLATSAAPFGLLALACALWVAGITPLDVHRLSDVGLIAVIPPLMAAGLVVLVGAFVVELRSPAPRAAVLGACTVLLAVMLHGLASAIESEPRIAVTWLHLGFVEYIARNGAVAPQLEARFDWPGFFALLAFAGRAAGVTDFTQIARWFPVAANLAYVVPMVMIARSLGMGVRGQWLAAWVFIGANWIGQDYLSPQAFALFLYLVVVAVMLTWFPMRPTRGLLAGWFQPDSEVPAPTGLAGWQRMSIFLLVVTITFAIVSSHQLTPFALILTIGILAIVRRIEARALPIIIGLLAAAWITYVTVPYLAGHLSELLGAVGKLNDVVAGNVVSRFAGSAQHQFIVSERIALTLAIWGLALLGFVRRMGTGRRDLVFAALAVAPFVLGALQDYGGEIALRIFLFSLPGMALLVASLLMPRPGAPPSWTYAAAVGLMSVVLIGGTITAKYGNERMDAMSPDEVAAATALYRIAPPRSLLLSAAPNTPWKFRDYERYQYRENASQAIVTNYKSLHNLLIESTYPAAYVLVTRSQEAYVELYSGLPPDAWPNLERNLAADVAAGKLKIVFSNRDAQVYQNVNA